MRPVIHSPTIKLKYRDTNSSELKEDRLLITRIRPVIFAVFAIALVGTFSALARTTSAQPQANDAAVKKADDLFQHQKYKEAIEAYKAILASDSNNDHVLDNIGLSYYKMGDRASARDWMQRRADLSGQSPSVKARMLTNVALFDWDEAHLNAAIIRAGIAGAPDATAVSKMVADGIEAAEKAVAIAPRSAQAFNLLNLLNREAFLLEPDSGKKQEYIQKAEAALRQCISFSSPEAIQSQGAFVGPMILSEAPGTIKVGTPGKKVIPDAFKDGKGDRVVVEAFVGGDGKVSIKRAVAGKGKPADEALAAAGKWQFEPSTFEGHPVTVIYSISFPQ